MMARHTRLLAFACALFLSLAFSRDLSAMGAAPLHLQTGPQEGQISIESGDQRPLVSNPTPEPAKWVLLVVGLLILGYAQRSNLRRRTSSPSRCG